MTNTTEPQTATERAREVIARIGVKEWNGASQVIDFDLWCADQIIAALHAGGLRIVSDATLAGAAYLITFGSEQSQLRDVTLSALESARTEATP